MSYQLFTGLFTEGSTDNRFLKSVVERTLDEVAFECRSEIETELFIIDIDKSGLSFHEQVLKASLDAFNRYGITKLCVYLDADGPTDSRAFENKLDPAIDALQQQEDSSYCKLTVPVVPIYMTEAWMLADTELIKRQIGTDKSDQELGLVRNPEGIAKPKEVIQEAIRIARADMTQKRRKDLNISELYQPIGQEIDLDHLERLSAYRKFKESMREAFRILNLLHD